jgi:hypothetical protein
MDRNGMAGKAGRLGCVSGCMDSGGPAVGCHRVCGRVAAKPMTAAAPAAAAPPPTAASASMAATATAPSTASAATSCGWCSEGLGAGRGQQQG